MNQENKWDWIGELNELAFEMSETDLIKVVEFARTKVYEK